MKKLLLMLCMLMGITAYTSAKETTWTSAPTSSEEWNGVLSTFSGSSFPTYWTINKTDGTQWDMTYKSDGVFFQRGSDGLAFGSSSKKITSVTLTSSENAFPGEITNVTIKGVSAGSKGQVDATVTVGGVSFTGNPASVSGTSPTDLVFTGTGSGQIVIILTQKTSGKQIKLKGLSVTYDPEAGSQTPKVDAPEITVNGTPDENGYYPVNTTVTMTAGVEMICYTLDGTVPTTDSELYTEPITLKENKTYLIKAIAYDDDFNASEVSELEVKVGEAPAYVTPPTITVAGEQDGEDYIIGATASISAPGASYVFYSLDGTDNFNEVEGESADLGKLPAGRTTIKAYCWDADANASEVVTSTVNVVKKAPEIAWSKTSCKVFLGEEPYELPELVNPHDLKVTYSIPDTDAEIATVDRETGVVTIVGVGTTNVRATYTTTADSDYKGSWVSYTLTVTQRAEDDSEFATEYTFDFTSKDYGRDTRYGLTLYSSGTKYEKDAENPVTSISDKGLTLTFSQPDNDLDLQYRAWQGSADKGNDLRVYNAIMTFSVGYGKIKSVTFIQTASSKWDENVVPELNKVDRTYVWTAPEGESLKSVSFKFTSRSDMGKIKVEYDLGVPAMPYIVSESDDDVVVECDAICNLRYKKTQQNTPAGMPARIADQDEWYNHGSHTITISKKEAENLGRDFTFHAYHEGTGVNSDELILSVANDGSVTGIEEIAVDSGENAPVEYYDLQGRRIINPANGGIYIRRQGNSVAKIRL